MSDVPTTIVATHTQTAYTDNDTVNSLEAVAAEIDQIRGVIQRDQITIDRLKAESKIITEHTDSVLARLCVEIEALGRTA